MKIKSEVKIPPFEYSTLAEVSRMTGIAESLIINLAEEEKIYFVYLCHSDKLNVERIHNIYIDNDDLLSKELFELESLTTTNHFTFGPSKFLLRINISHNEISTHIDRLNKMRTLRNLPKVNSSVEGGAIHIKLHVTLEGLWKVYPDNRAFRDIEKGTILFTGACFSPIERVITSSDTVNYLMNSEEEIQRLRTDEPLETNLLRITYDQVEKILSLQNKSLEAESDIVEKPLNPKTKNSHLTLIAALMKAGNYSVYVDQNNRLHDRNEIDAIVSRAGLRMDPDSLSKILKEALELLRK